MVAMGLANEDGSSYLSRLCKLTPVQVDHILYFVRGGHGRMNYKDTEPYMSAFL
jgi:hypothetical protein